MSSSGLIGKINAGGNNYLVGSTAYATCDSGAETTYKVATLQDGCSDFTLIQGVTLHVKFTNANTVNSPSMAVAWDGGTTSYKVIKRSGNRDVGNIPTRSWQANSIVSFTYDGTYWVMNDYNDSFATSDTQVAQNPMTDSSTHYVLFTPSNTSTAETTTAGKNTGLSYVPSTGTLSVSGTVTVGSAPSADMQVATKKYVDDSISGAGGGTVLEVTAGTGLKVGDGSSSSITSSGTLNHSNTAQSMSLADSEYNDARIWVCLFDSEGHIRKYRAMGIDPSTLGSIPTVDGVYGDTINRYADCNTAASTSAKVASVQSGTIDSLGIGTRVSVRFYHGSEAGNSDATLNIDNTGAYNIYYNGTQVADLILPEDAIIDFMFDAYNRWCIINYDFSQDIADVWDAIPSVTNSYSSTGTDAITGTGVAAALGTLDSSISATSGQAISAVTITDGKITSSSKISVGETNQNAFSNVKVGSNTIAADSKTDTLELVAGTGITLTADTTNDKVTITSTAVGGVSDVQVGGTSVVSNGVANLITNSTYNSSSNKIATMSDLPDEIFVVNVTLTSLTAGTSDKTATEIYNAARAGKFVVAKVPYSAGTTTVAMVAPLSHADIDDGAYSAVFEYHDNEYIGFSYARLVIINSTVSLTTSYEGYLFEGGSAEGGVSISAINGLELGSNGGNLSNGQTITVGHSNSVTAQSTQAVYPIAIDAQGHISSYGNAVTIPTVPSAGTTATAVSTTASGGSATTWSKSDHVHSISSSTITSALGYTPPTDDTKVTNTLGTTTKYYVTGTTSSTTNTGTQIFDTGIYSTTTAGQLNATTYKVNEQVTLQWNSTDASLDFIFS